MTALTKKRPRRSEIIDALASRAFSSPADATRHEAEIAKRIQATAPMVEPQHGKAVEERPRHAKPVTPPEDPETIEAVMARIVAKMADGRERTSADLSLGLGIPRGKVRVAMDRLVKNGAMKFHTNSESRIQVYRDPSVPRSRGPKA